MDLNYDLKVINSQPLSGFDRIMCVVVKKNGDWKYSAYIEAPMNPMSQVYLMWKNAENKNDPEYFDQYFDAVREFDKDFSKVIKQDLTAIQLKSWLILFIDRLKLKNLTIEEAEEIGRDRCRYRPLQELPERGDGPETATGTEGCQETLCTQRIERSSALDTKSGPTAAEVSKGRGSHDQRSRQTLSQTSETGEAGKRKARATGSQLPCEGESDAGRRTKKT